MKLSQSVTYAVHAALRLTAANGSGPVSCGCLAREGKMPERFLLQILRDLTKKGILQSTRGGGGGFMLSRSADEISLLDLIEAVDGPLDAGLPRSLGFPEPSETILNDTLRRVRESVRRELSAITVTDLARGMGLYPVDPWQPIRRGDDRPREVDFLPRGVHDRAPRPALTEHSRVPAPIHLNPTVTSNMVTP